MQTISIIVAFARTNQSIGKDGKIPWNLPEDIDYFNEMTMGHSVIMGRKTHESIKKTLSGRKNIVISSQERYVPFGGTFLARTFEEARIFAGEGEVFVIGGEQVYREAYFIAENLFITFIDGSFEGDAFFPEWNADDWNKISCEKIVSTAKNAPTAEKVIFKRKI